MKECPACRRCFPDEINHCPQDGDATTPSLIGEPILDARYQLERRLGQGGMGVVFQARHIFLKTSHAIKVILPDLVGNDPMLVTRFRQEALAAAAIRHQNIIAVTDFGVVRGTMPFLVMEFVNGKSLQDILAAEKRMSPERALEFACAIGAGVSAAHRQNIVHRDLKPLNIMTQTGQSIAEGLKILDFGLAKIKSGELLGSFVQAKTSGLMGSPFYMAPEQWSDEEPDARADVYSLGIILYQMLSGDVPFKGTSIPSIMKKHLTLPPPSFQSVGVDIAPRIEAVVYHALEKDPAARIPTVDAFLQELREAVAAESGTMRAGRQTLPPELDRTLFEPSPDTAAMPQQTTAESAFDSMAGTVSSAALSPEEQEKISASRLAYEQEQKEKDRIAREELAREADARRKAEEEKERKRKEQEERVRKEKEAQEERERQQREQMARVERQARELEERLAKLATSISPTGATVADLEATQVHQDSGALSVANTSLPGVAPAAAQSSHKFEVSIPAKPKSNSTLMIAGVGLVVLLTVAAVVGYFWMKSKDVVVGGPGPNINNNGNPGASPTPAPIKAELIEIPGGTFQMGRDDGPLQEAPAHSVTVPSFLMDKTEVTNAEYEQFVQDTNRRSWPEHWKGPQAPYGRGFYPVSNVSLQDANDFAAWRSKRDNVKYRLPTEAEWEYAARNGDKNNFYPWGNDWKLDNAVLNQSDAEAVGSRTEGNNSWGVQDLIGNVWEWTSSEYAVYPGSEGEVPRADRGKVIYRGFGYASDPTGKTKLMTSCWRDAGQPNFKSIFLGFRLVRPTP
ncbi:MAG TPA: bifunctional serine/threonine-protein kinase/formylglycine-generating enzyme family protein [Pyrinomonadaceae bacterium]|nr:bifunctional serine/threonine-protein kinase/formylglycine-generating enzyme family protein [Pyrinomonadaceae bacterium]